MQANANNQKIKKEHLKRPKQKQKPGCAGGEQRRGGEGARIGRILPQTCWQPERKGKVVPEEGAAVPSLAYRRRLRATGELPPRRGARPGRDGRAAKGGAG